MCLVIVLLNLRYHIHSAHRCEFNGVLHQIYEYLLVPLLVEIDLKVTQEDLARPAEA